MYFGVKRFKGASCSKFKKPIRHRTWDVASLKVALINDVKGGM